MDVIEKYASKASGNTTIRYFVAILVVVNAAVAVLNLPNNIVSIFTIPVVQGIIFSIGAYGFTGNVMRSATIGVVLAVAFFILSSYGENFTLVEPKVNVMPGCAGATVKDLLDLFDNNQNALKTAMIKAEVPFNLTLKDENAGLIATYLVQLGHKVNETCRAPNM